MNAIIGTGKISKRQHGITAERDVSITMSDGITINADIFRPDDKGKFPVLLLMTPFNKEIQSDRIWPGASRTRRIRGISDAAIEAAPIDFFVRRGYVHIIGSVRGTGRSGGAYQFMSPKENTDTCEVIEWAAKQAWCNGKVGMLGIGGRAVSHFLVAALQPPHLKAIAPLAIFWDNYRELSWPGGIFASGHLRWLTSLVNLDVHTERSEIRKELGEVGFKEAIARTLVDDDVIADPQLADALKNPDAPTNASLVDAFLHPTYSSYWKDRAVTDVDKIKVPAYLATISHRPGVLYHWSDLKIPKKMVYLPPA